MRPRTAVVTLFHRCNYACGFCYLRPRNRTGELGPLGTRDGMRMLGDYFAQHGEWELHLTGGEPSLHPEFMTVCCELTRQHRLSLSTNLSFDVAAFLREVPAARIASISATLQPEGEQELAGFMAKMRLLREAEITCATAYVATPERLPGLPALRARFRAEGIPLCVQALNGEYRGQSYPAAYSNEEKQCIRAHSLLYISPLLLDLNQTSFPHGEPCGAGCSRVIVNGLTGEVRPCAHLPACGNLHTGELRLLPAPLPCSASECICELNDTLQQFHEKRLAHHYAEHSAITAEEWDDFIALATRNRDWLTQLVTQVRQAAHGRAAWLWGTGAAARQRLTLLQQAGIEMAGVVAGRNGECAPQAGLQCVERDSFLQSVSPSAAYLIVASEHARDIGAELQQRGWRWRDDYLY